MKTILLWKRGQVPFYNIENENGFKEKLLGVVNK